MTDARWLRIAIAALVLLSAGRATAQTPPVPRLQAGFGIDAAVPLGDFGANVESAGGFLGHLDTAIGESVFSVGGEVSYLWYGEEQHSLALGALVPEIPDATIEVNTTNAMLMLHARLRAQRPSGRWRPYADGLFGFTDLFTKSSIEGGLSCSGGFLSGSTCIQTNLASATNSRDFVLSYGGGAGVMIGFKKSPQSPRLDISGRYIRGGEGTYLTEGAIRREAGVATFAVSQSRTDLFALYIGVAFGR